MLETHEVDQEPKFGVYQKIPKLEKYPPTSQEKREEKGKVVNIFPKQALSENCAITSKEISKF